MPGARVTSGTDITLRTVEREDAQFLQRAYAAPELRRPLGRRVRNVSEVENRIGRRAEDDDYRSFLVCLDEGRSEGTDDGSTPVGVVLARRVTSRPNLAIWVAPEYHGDGYGREAISLLIDLLFRNYDVPSIGAGVYSFNEASQRLLESVGFTQEGRQRKVQFYDGAYHDNLKYGMLREEWESRSEREG